ncbi:hypothetical protein CDEF62S_03871 [Castellaniella defragrans]
MSSPIGKRQKNDVANTKTVEGNPHEDYVTRAEAISLLGIKADTLYSYVSRGLIRRLRHPGNRHSLYSREDIERVHARSDARRSEGVVAAGAILYGGEPVIETSITEITQGGPLYRGHSAIELAMQAVSFEVVAELLWSGASTREPVVWKFDPPLEGFHALADALGGLAPDANIQELFSIITVGLGISHGAPGQRAARGSMTTMEGRQLIQVLTGCFAFLSHRRTYRPFQDGETIAAAMAQSLDIDPTTEVIRILNAALVLSADHELSPATFSARIAASSAADVHSCIAAAISTHSGTRIARACDQLEEAFLGTGTKSQLVEKILPSGKDRLSVPGFNHPIYHKGDPRARCLLQILKESVPPCARLKSIYEFLDIAAEQYKIHPRIETAIVVMVAALHLPPGSAAGIYTIGRTAGWVAHIIEQQMTGYLIRPRAKFIDTIP